MKTPTIQSIQKRFSRLHVSQAALARASVCEFKPKGVAKAVICDLMNNRKPGVNTATFDALELALTRLERRQSRSSARKAVSPGSRRKSASSQSEARIRSPRSRTDAPESSNRPSSTPNPKSEKAA